MITVMRTHKNARFSIMLLLLALFTIGLARPSLAADTENDNYSDAEVAQLMSPIALYPDSLLTHVLIAASYPLEVVQAQRWRKQHKNWDNDQLTNEGGKQGWDPSVVALLAFPEVLDKMSTDLDWTAKVGEAFVANEGQVMDSIQQLRQAAYKAGSLADAKNIKVQNDEERIVIVPSNPQVVYVPYYDTRYVYGDWYWGAYPPVYWSPFPGYVAAPHSRLYWRHRGVSISFNFFFGHMFWHDRTVWVDYRHRHTRYIHPRRHHSFEGQRWHHRPEHRRGIHYRSNLLNKRYQPKLHRAHNREEYRRVNDAMKQHHLRDQRHLAGRDHMVPHNKAANMKRAQDRRHLAEHNRADVNSKHDKPASQRANIHHNTTNVAHKPTERPVRKYSTNLKEQRPNIRHPDRAKTNNVPRPKPQLNHNAVKHDAAPRREFTPRAQPKPQRRIEQPRRVEHRSAPRREVHHRNNSQVRRHEN